MRKNLYRAGLVSLLAVASVAAFLTLRPEPRARAAQGATIQTFSQLWNPPSLAPDGRAYTYVGVVGASVGRPCVAGLSSIADYDKIVITCRVQSDGYAQVSVYNEDSSTIDIPSGTVRVAVIDF